MLVPLLLKLMLQDLSAPLPGESGVFKAKLAHLHVVLAGHKEDGLSAGMQLHLTPDPVPIEVSKPPTLCPLTSSRLDKRDPEEPLRSGAGRLLRICH